MENQKNSQTQAPPTTSNAMAGISEKFHLNKTFWTGITIGLVMSILAGASVFVFQEKRINRLTNELASEMNKNLSTPNDFYERNLKMMEVTLKAKETGQGGLALADARDKLMDTSSWNQKRAINKKQYGEGSPQDHSFSFKYPTDWNLEEKVDEKGCGEYKVAKPQVGQLKIEVVCTGWAATYYPIPGDSVIVKKITGTTDDGSAVYAIRFMSDSNSTYRYVEVLVYPPDRNIDVSKDKMEDKMFFTAPILLDVELKPNGYGSDMETALLVADTIVNSISK